jgi:hypothetical protein
MTDEEAKNAIADTTIHAVPSYANAGVHTGKKNDDTVEKFLANEDAALGNRSSIPEIFPLPTVSHVITQRADGLFYDENGSEWIQVVTAIPHRFGMIEPASEYGWCNEKMFYAQQGEEYLN